VPPSTVGADDADSSAIRGCTGAALVAAARTAREALLDLTEHLKACPVFCAVRLSSGIEVDVDTLTRLQIQMATGER